MALNFENDMIKNLYWSTNLDSIERDYENEPKNLVALFAYPNHLRVVQKKDLPEALEETWHMCAPFPFIETPQQTISWEDYKDEDNLCTPYGRTYLGNCTPSELKRICALKAFRVAQLKVQRDWLPDLYDDLENKYFIKWDKRGVFVADAAGKGEMMHPYFMYFKSEEAAESVINLLDEKTLKLLFLQA